MEIQQISPVWVLGEEAVVFVMALVSLFDRSAPDVRYTFGALCIIEERNRVLSTTQGHWEARF